MNSHANPVVAGFKNRIVPSNLRVNVLVDCTKSSLLFGAAIKTTLSDTARELEKRVARIEFGLHVSRDLEFDRDADFSMGLNLGVDEFVLNVGRLDFIGGADPLETQLDSVITILRTYPAPLGSGTRRALVLATSSDSKRTREGLDLDAVAAEANTMGYRCIVVAPTGLAIHRLAAVTGGVSIELSLQPKPSDVDLCVSALTKTLTVVAAAPNHGATVALGA